ncbi:Protein kinase domain-containing protein [Caenorhabditis elegans]|uniref:Protein kinase domain-containing protein n=1 Tax=Caenorhabditis elegans TaxID=6239 RepID=Q22223_CAEEL|nr:Protein kinase domain-containing protein [Caenorhabditis elegans]CAA91303.1 Protein kinase domain-containing protein [Caenorhabditis elegans]|eukprot:NP_495715.1 Uncharacterized protein CELE_T05C12.1 [Caenorhabditis elegans]
MLNRNRNVNKQNGHQKQNGAQKSELRGKNAPPYLERETCLGRNDIFVVEKMIAGGGFGQVYRARNTETQEEVAVKVERATTNDSQRMILESKVLDDMLGSKHFPNVYYIGPYHSYNFIVMQMLGKNIGDIRKMMPNKKISILSSVRIGIQIIEALSLLHSKGWLHRDLKPTNCCLGLDEKRKTVYLVDFGMSRKFRNDNGSLRESRTYCGFRGTTRYCSYRMHDRREQGPVDDLWCLYYSLGELIEGCLPWRDIESADEMAHVKKILKHEDIFHSMPSKFASFGRNLRRLRPANTPDYTKFQNILAYCVKFVDDNAEFEWDVMDY